MLNLFEKYFSFYIYYLIKDKYQKRTSFPHAKPINVPKIKNGPKGTSDFIFFFFKMINSIPIKAPKKKDIKRDGKIRGHPRNNPKRNTSFTSPKPIAFP